MAHGEEDLIGIPFPNHSSEVLCSLNEQRRAGLLCDVVLIVRDQEYRTHRSVLAACSQYFKKLFTVATDPSSTAAIAEQHAHVYELDFVAPESLTAILEFAYTSTLTVTASNVKEILSAARMLEIPCIINVCLEIIDTGGGGGGGGSTGEVEQEEYEEEEEEEDDDEDEEEEMEGEEADAESREEDEDSERSTQLLENQTTREGRRDSPPCSSQPGLLGPGTEPAEDSRGPPQGEGSRRVPQGLLESRALKDFSIEALLQEGLYPKVPGLDRGAGFAPLLPGFYPPMWAAELQGFPQILDPHHPALHPHASPSLPLPLGENSPLDLAVKKEVIKEELKEEAVMAASGILHRDFLKDLMGAGLGVGSDPTLGQIKDETELRSYLSFLSASHLGALFPPWPLEEDRKKPKASQQCPICNKVIQGAGKLPRHMRTHTGEKPYMCTICEVRFTRQDKLKIHMRKHTGERPYICLHCNSKFVHNYDLKNHLRIHTGVRPYQCQHCFKSFTRSDHLHRHIKRQSCRVSRPRRGRKPSTWRSAGAGFLYPPNPHLPEGQTLPGTLRLPVHGAPLVGQTQPERGSPGGTRESAAEARVVDRKSEAAARKRGVFAFALARDDALPHPPFYPMTPNPWNMRLERVPPIPEAAN